MTAVSLTPTKLRLILSITLILILALSGGVFYLAYKHLNTVAIDAGRKVSDATQSQNTVQQLQKLKQELEMNQDAISRASHVAADGQNYTYQDQIVSDLTAYAARSGMAISNITFSAAANSSVAPVAAATPSDPTPAGLKKTTITITLKSPTDYKGLLNFLHYVEQNLTKLKIANVTLAKSDAGKVNVDVLSLEVYLR